MISPRFGLVRLRPVTGVGGQQRTSTVIPTPLTHKLVDFENAKDAFKSKTTGELVLAAMVFRLSSIRFLVSNAQTLINLSCKIFGTHLTYNMIIRNTFFKHFCAGETSEEIRPVVARLNKVGIGAILDYAAENDVPEEKEKVKAKKNEAPKPGKRLEDVLYSRQRSDVISAQIYDYVDEAGCDKNLETVLECIRHGAEMSTPDRPAFCAVKLTALGKPSLLEQMSAILMCIRRSWVEGFAVAHISRATPLEEFRSIVSCPNIAAPISMEDWKVGLKRICKRAIKDEEAERMFHVLDTGKDGQVDYLDYTRLLSLEALSLRLDGKPVPDDLRPLTHSGAFPLLSDSEEQCFRNLVNRIKTFASLAAKHNVRCMIDAEQTYLQVAIDHFAILLQRLYNKETPIIYNTYQCYLEYSKVRILNDLERSRREGWHFAGKLVRGAYMNQEREIAKQRGYHSPIWPTIEATHANFDECAQLVLDEMTKGKPLGLMIGSHNKRSLELIVNRMARNGIDKKTGGVYFGQLLGMADHLSLPLGQNGYGVYKYVPYGPIQEVMPYLIRRAQENSTMLSNNQSEYSMITDEIKRRMLSFS